MFTPESKITEYKPSAIHTLPLRDRALLQQHSIPEQLLDPDSQISIQLRHDRRQVPVTPATRAVDGRTL